MKHQDQLEITFTTELNLPNTSIASEAIRYFIDMQNEALSIQVKQFDKRKFSNFYVRL